MPVLINVAPLNMFVLWLFSLCFLLLCLAAFLLMLPSCACSRNLPPLSSLFCGFSLNVAPLLCLAAFLLMLPSCACSRNLPPLSSLFCGFSLNVAPLLCLVAFLFIVAPLFVLPLSCGCSLNIAHLLFLWLLPPCLSCRCFILPLSLSCGFSLNVAPLFCLVAVLLMLPPSFLVPVLVVCPPCLAAFLLMLLSLATW